MANKGTIDVRQATILSMEKRNKIERYKAERSATAFGASLPHFDWHHPTESDRFYLKSYGIYNLKVRPDAWMIRLRIDGGIAEAAVLERIARIAQSYELQILLTARSQIELHGLTAETVYPIWHMLQNAGIETRQSLTDNFRAIVTDPLDGLSPDSPIHCAPLIEAIRELFLNVPEWMGTIPRKFNTALIGRESPSFNPWGNDLLFALARREGVWGFNVYLGGKNSHVAQNADLFCAPGEAPALFDAIAQTYQAHGMRGSRAKIRLFHLIESVGMAQVHAWIEENYGTSLTPAGELKMLSASTNTDPTLPIQRFGHYGEVKAKGLLHVAREAREKKLTLRLTPHQELWMFDAEDFGHAAVLSGDDQRKCLWCNTLRFIPHSNITACAGSRYCPLALWDIKSDLPALPLKLLEKHGISLGLSGCLKGCGRHYHNDLGLIGLRTNLYGETERAVRLFVGATQSPVPAPGRMIYYSVPERMLTPLIETIVEDFVRSNSENFEAFSHDILRKYSVEFLQFWWIVRQLHELPEGVFDDFFRSGEKWVLERIRREIVLPDFEALHDVIRELGHRLWDATPTRVRA